MISSPIAVSTLEYVQKASGLQGRVSRILVEPKPGQKPPCGPALQRIAGGRYGVESASYDEELFAKAAAATNQSTQLFAVISALVGFLFAFNAMLLTVPQRRRLIADLRRDGYTPRAVIAVLMFDAVVLGTIACAIGLVLGDELSIHLFHSNPGYLSSAFAVGSERVVNLQSIADLRARRDGRRERGCAEPFQGHRLAQSTGGDRNEGGQPAAAPPWPLTVAGLVCLVATLVILLAAPQAAIVGMVTLIAALLGAAGSTAHLRCSRSCARSRPTIVSAVPHIAVMELRAGRSRAIAIAATGAIAVFGSVSIQGAHSDLLNGLYNAASDVNASTDVWVSAAGNSNLLMTSPFAPTQQAKLRALPGVRSVRIYRGGLLDFNDRRIWVIAPPSEASPLVPPTQLVEGNVAQADAHLREGGWAVVSLALAEEHKLKIGQPFTLPTPNPDHIQGGGDQHQYRLGSRRDHHELQPITRRPGEAPTQAPTTC